MFLNGMGIMTQSKDYRLFLDERFDKITTLMNARFESVDDKLDSIEAHVIHTNGRVSDLECESKKRQKAVDDFYELRCKLRKIKKSWMYLLIGGVLFVVVVNMLFDTGMLIEIVKTWLR